MSGHCELCENKNAVWGIEDCRLFMRNDECRTLTISFCPKCGRRLYPDSVVGKIPKEEINEMFEVLWKIYPRKEGKEQAKKTFEHKLRGLQRAEAKAKGNKIFVLMKNKIKSWTDNDTELRFIPLFSTMLNNEVPDSPHYGGGKKV